MNQTLMRHSSTTGTPTASREQTVARRSGTPVRRTPVRPSDGRRPGPARPQAVRPAPVRTGTAVCADGRRHAPVSRRPAPITWGAAVVAGIGLAVALWAIVLGGSAAESSAAPVAGTEVVHVRSGESLGELAQRVAPDQSSAAVVADIKDLNHMSGSAVSAGQPLLAPVYRG